MERVNLDNDKSFAVYALILLTGVVSVLTATVLSGITRVPPPLVFLEHVAMGLMIPDGSGGLAIMPCPVDVHLGESN